MEYLYFNFLVKIGCLSTSYISPAVIFLPMQFKIHVHIYAALHGQIPRYKSDMLTLRQQKRTILSILSCITGSEG